MQFAKETLIALTATCFLSGQSLAQGLSEQDVAPFEKRLNDHHPLTDEQLAQLGTLIKAHPDEAYLHFLLARHQRRLGYTQLSDETIKEARQVPDASGFFKKSIEQSVANADIARALMVMQFAQDWHANTDIARALSAFALSENANIAKDDESRTALKAKAEKEMRSLLQQKSSWPLGVGGLLGQIRYTEGKFGQAIELADVDLSKDKKALLANEVKGLSYMHMGNMRAAVAPLAMVFEKSPENGRTTPSYAQALIATNQNRQALAPALYSLTQAADQDQLILYEKRLAGLISRFPPEVVDATVRDVTAKAQWTNQVYTFFFALAETFEMAGRSNEALRSYATAISVNKAPTTALNRLARLHQKAGRYSEAQMCYLLSVAANRNNVNSAMAFNRLTMRIANRPNDVAWQLKDWLRRSLSGPRRAAPSAKRS